MIMTSSWVNVTTYESIQLSILARKGSMQAVLNHTQSFSRLPTDSMRTVIGSAEPLSTIRRAHAGRNGSSKRQMAISRRTANGASCTILVTFRNTATSRLTAPLGSWLSICHCFRMSHWPNGDSPCRAGTARRRRPARRGRFAG